MPLTNTSAQNHEKRAKSNYIVYKRLVLAGINDWATTTLFYTALHLVQAYFVEVAASGFDIPRTHEARLSKVSLKLMSIFADYRTLQNASENARYEPYVPILTDEELRKLHDDRFQRVVHELATKGVSL